LSSLPPIFSIPPHSLNKNRHYPATHTQFPTYLSENATTLPADEKTRYESQLDRITKIVRVFEDPGYSDEDKEKAGEVVELMGQVRFFAFCVLVFFFRLSGGVGYFVFVFS